MVSLLLEGNGRGHGDGFFCFAAVPFGAVVGRSLVVDFPEMDGKSTVHNLDTLDSKYLTLLLL